MQKKEVCSNYKSTEINTLKTNTKRTEHNRKEPNRKVSETATFYTCIVATFCRPDKIFVNGHFCFFFFEYFYSFSFKLYFRLSLLPHSPTVKVWTLQNIIIIVSKR